VADGDFVIMHGRFSGFAKASIGSPRTFFASKAESSWSIGTSFKTKSPGKSPKAPSPCLATIFRVEHFSKGDIQCGQLNQRGAYNEALNER
jgi:hypothetical protein